ncbi:MAG TPA: ribose-5-phosphate isomerase RpiA [Thermoanaerobaculia bacterium]|nr:ribose-5-phosphate isomerase RpiA [Thermoanaerobaculia bacterium]
MGSDARALKIDAARAAIAEVRSSMVVGLGTGSTAEEFIRLLGEETAAGRLTAITAVCTSNWTVDLARSLGISCVALSDVDGIDLAVDGADEIDPHLRMIKGRGGALLREKIVEQAAKRFLVIADGSKEVERLGGVPLPVEVVQFVSATMLRRFETLGLPSSLRHRDGRPLVTDEGHHLIDLVLPSDRDVAEVVTEIRRFAGVVETGFFPDEATEAIIARRNGVVRRRR